jgi:hypothetical protein
MVLLVPSKGMRHNWLWQKKGHLTCVQCILKEHILEQMGKSGSGICCVIEGCSETINDDDLNGKILPNLYSLYVQQGVLLKVLDNRLKSIIENQQLNHRIIMSSLQTIQVGLQRAPGAMAFLVIHNVKKCPTSLDGTYEYRRVRSWSYCHGFDKFNEMVCDEKVSSLLHLSAYIHGGQSPN